MKPNAVPVRLNSVWIIVLVTFLGCRVTTLLAATEVHISFTGIVSIHHESNKPIDRVEIPAVEHHQPAKVTGECISDHDAFIVVDRSVLNVIKEPADWSDRPPKGNLRLYKIPYGTHLAVDSIAGTGGAKTNADVADPTCQYVDNGNLYNVPRLSNLALPTCVVAPPTSATYDITSGEFRAWVLNEHMQDFISSSSGAVKLRQRIADVVDWQFTVTTTNRLTLKDGANDFLVVEGIDPTVPIAIVTGSAELRNLEKVLDGKKDQIHDHDPHFDIYYDRCTNPGDRPIPYDDGVVSCKADTLWQTYSWWPKWVHQVHKVAGGFNCGPDQFP